MAAEPWTADADGVVIDVRLTPRGGRDAIDGIARGAEGRAVLKVRVRAAPFEGQANEALCSFIAKRLGVAVRSVSVMRGATARLKQIRVVGEAAALVETLRRGLSDSG